MIVEDIRLKATPLTDLTGGGNTRHHPEVRVDKTSALAVLAGTLGIGREQRRLDPISLGKRLADRF